MGTRSVLLVSSRAVTLMPISGMSLSIAATRLPQVGQKPRFASPLKVSYQVGSLSPVQVTVSKPHPPHHGGAAELLATFACAGVGEDGRTPGGEADAAAQAAAGAYLGFFDSLGVSDGGGVHQVICQARWAS
ncbi:hypothetical protein ACIPSH_20755 [Streptomyces iakyrus]|uniref:hypothetical protein n=1 Tax=Streptomyces TaxID=1883 RepID=UPI003811B22F